MRETIQEWRDKQRLKRKLTFNQNITLRVIDGDSIKLFNKVGIIIISIGIITILANIISK